MEQRDWNKDQEYLLNTRKYFWNDDYLNFLVKNVWEINKPVKVIDFGCGFGYLGLKLLPILPQGSSYTGIDIAANLLEKGKILFKELPYEYNFINADLTEYTPESEYDLAICQAVLRHIPQYDTVLRKMIASVGVNGKVICIEVNRRIENSGLYIYGEERNVFNNDDEKKNEWLSELNSGGRDFLTGSKIPVLMEKFGLKDVSIRVNDYVEYVSPYSDDYNTHVADFAKEHGLRIDKQDIYATNVRGLLISFGTKK